MLADVYNFLRDDIPLRKLWNQHRFLRAESALVQHILSLEIHMVDGFRCGINLRRSGLSKYLEFTRQYRSRCKTAGIQVRLRYTHQIACLIYIDLDMGSAAVILDTAIGIVAHKRHVFRSLIHMGIAGVQLVLVSLEVFFEFIVLHQHREQCHHNGGSVTAAAVEGVVFKGLHIAIIDARQQGACIAVVHNKMIGIRTDRGFILCRRAMIYDADSALTGPVHAMADRMDRLDHRAAKGRSCPVAVLGRYLDLFVCNGVKRRRQPSAEIKNVVDVCCHTLLPFCTQCDRLILIPSAIHTASSSPARCNSRQTFSQLSRVGRSSAVRMISVNP